MSRPPEVTGRHLLEPPSRAPAQVAASLGTLVFLVVQQRAVRKGTGGAHFVLPVYLWFVAAFAARR